MKNLIFAKNMYFFRYSVLLKCPACLISSLVIFVALVWANGSVFAQDAGDSSTQPCFYICNHKYALCSAASCDEEGNCGKCDKQDGSCGYCYVFEGKSISTPTPCKELEPSGNTVYSTYSKILTEKYGFMVMTCKDSKKNATALCMNAKCELTGNSVVLEDKNGEHLIPTAICKCEIVPPGKVSEVSTLGGKCNEKNCSAIWSVAPCSTNLGPSCSK